MIYRFIVFKFILISTVNSDVDFNKYKQMPDLDAVDDYDACLSANKENYVFCTVQATIRPDNNSELWKYIEDYSKNERHVFRHDRLRRGVCVNWCVNELSKLNDSMLDVLDIEPFSSVYSNPPQKYPASWFIDGDEHYQKYRRIINTCINHRLNKSHNLLAYSEPETCSTANDGNRKIDTLDKLFVVFIIALVFLIIASSVTDLTFKRSGSNTTEEYYEKNLEKRLPNILVSFSIYRNWKTLVAPRPHDDHKIMHVLRFFFCTTNTFAHVLAFIVASPVTNKLFIEDYSNVYNFIFSASIVVHSFYVMTGFIVSYKFFQHMEKNPKYDFRKLVRDVINRLTRICPLYIFFIFFSSTWLIHVGSGPIWKLATEVERTHCRKNWWTNLLFINNYVNADEPCFLQSFFLSVDFQMLIIALIMFSIIWKNPKTIKFIFTIAMIYSFVVVAVVVYWKRYDGVLGVWPEYTKHFFMEYDMYLNYHVPTHVNTGNYFAGMIGGYLYFKMKKSKVDLAENKLFTSIWYPSVLPSLLILCFSGSIYMFYEFEKPSIWIALHATIIKNCYGIVYSFGLMGFLIHLGGFVREIFHHRIFLIISRLTFGVFLNHIIVIRYLEGTKHTMGYASAVGVLTTLIYTEVLSFLLAAITCITIEFPFTNLFNVILRKNKPGITNEDVKNKNDLMLNANYGVK